MTEKIFENQIPKVVPRKMVEELLGQPLVKDSSQVLTDGQTMFVQYVHAAPMLKAHWIIQFRDGETVMVLDENGET
jgi:hypothetical protein